MNYLKIILFALLVGVVTTSQAKRKDKLPVYAFGIAASFTDTLVYHTEIQILDSVFLDRNKFLPERDNYSYQLKNFLEFEKNEPNRTCMIYFSEKKSTVEKNYNKLVKLYNKQKNIKMVKIDPKEFKFAKPTD